MICLSTTVRNDTLQEAKEHRVSLKCRKQLRVEELEMVMPLESTVLVLSQLQRMEREMVSIVGNLSI